MSESDKLVNGVDSKIYYFQKVFADIIKLSDESSNKPKPKQDFGDVDVSSSDEINTMREMYETKIKDINVQHENLVTETLKTYKGEVHRLMQDNKDLVTQLKTTQDQVKSRDSKVTELETSVNQIKDVSQKYQDTLSINEKKVRLCCRNNISLAF